MKIPANLSQNFLVTSSSTVDICVKMTSELPDVLSTRFMKLVNSSSSGCSSWCCSSPEKWWWSSSIGCSWPVCWSTPVLHQLCHYLKSYPHVILHLKTKEQVLFKCTMYILVSVLQVFCLNFCNVFYLQDFLVLNKIPCTVQHHRLWLYYQM